MRTLTITTVTLAAGIGLCASTPVPAAMIGNRIATNRLAANRIAANKLAANRISSNRLAGNRISGNRLAANRIAINGLVIAADPEAAGGLLATVEGREVFRYLVSCALPARQTVVATVDATTYEFPGGLGLAPKWRRRALRPSEQRWVSACMLARVNAHGVAVTISMRGSHRALTASAAEAAAFGVEEGAFYGNIFAPAEEPVAAFACRGAGQAASEAGALVDRDCTEPGEVAGKTQCGFSDAGDCRDLSGAPWACAVRNDGAYGRCHQRGGLGVWPTGTTHKEVITVYLATDPAAVLAPVE